MKMSDFDYKKYSLEKIDEWVNDALSTADASPQEIYDTIKKAVEEQYYYFKHHTGRAYELLALLNGNGKGHIQGWKEWEETYYPEEAPLSCDRNDSSPECKNSWTSFWEETDDGMRPWGHSDLEYKGSTVSSVKQDKVKRWVLPVEEVENGDTGEQEYFITFPDDLLEAANLKEGDSVEYLDQGDGSYLLKKIENQMTYDEMIAAGYTMTDDGFWIKEN
jgi:hypothetical protein